MKSLKLCALLVAGLAAGQVQAAGDAEAGQQKAMVCAACHGADGNSPIGMYPKLAGQSERYLAKQMHEFKDGTRQDPVMQLQVATLSDQDIADLAAYFASLTMSTGVAKADLVAQGERLYRGGNMETQVPACSGCHGPAGDGIAAAAFPRLGGQNAEYVEAQLKAFRAAGRRDLDAPQYRRNDADGEDAPGMMQAVAARMSDMEIRAVSSYISGLSR